MIVFFWGSDYRNPKLQKLALEIFLALRKYHISLHPVWESRDDEIIQWADSGSRDFRSDDCSLDPPTIDLLCNTFGKFTIDAFVSAPNSICKTFAELFSSEFYFAFPPVGKAISAIKHFASF